MTKTFQSGAQAPVQPKAWPAFPASLIRIAIFLLFLLMPIFPRAWGQALPAAEASPISTGFTLPHIGGTLQYGVSASETLTYGYFGTSGDASASNISGDLAYLSNSKLNPFSMVFSGGRSWSTSGQPSYNYLNFAVSQVITTRLWTLVLSDSPNYLPATPTTGLSGVPGVGDLGVEPVQVGTETGQGILTNYSSRITNSSSGSLQSKLTGKTFFNISGAYGFTRFLGNPGNNGLDSVQETGGAGLSHLFDTRNTISGNYAYSHFTYSGGQSEFVSQTASLAYSRQMTRKFSTSFSAGPQLTSINYPGSSPTLSLFAQASANYAAHFTHLTLGFSRSTNSGYGVVAGSIANEGNFSVSRTFARVWNCSASAAYTQSSNLAGTNSGSFSAQTAVGGLQLSRALARSLSAYGSYTLEHQSTSGSATTVDLYSGVSQVAGFGLTYSPAAFHLGHQ